jgi:GNAT superfamily N-acetyltransferase
MPFQLQVAAASDIPRIRELIAASVRGLQVEYSSEQREAALSTVFTVDSQLVADETYLVAISEDGRFAGCGGWSRRKTLYGGDHQVEAVSADLLDPAADAAKIRAIFVHPDFARMGLGSLLLQAAEQAARQEGFTRFEMGSTLSGVPLYKRKGYDALEEIDVPVGEGRSISVVRMAKSVKSAANKDVSAKSPSAEGESGRW